jgi:hypothetical protein
VARNDHEAYGQLATKLGLKPDVSPATIFEKIDSMDQATLQTIADDLESDIIDRIKNGPWYLKVDTVHDLLNRRLDQISAESEILPKIEFDRLDLSKADFKNAAFLMAHGYTRQQLLDKGMKESEIDKATETYFKTDEDGTIIPDADGKPQFKESVKPDDFKTEIKTRQTPTQAQKTQAKTEIKASLPDNHEEVIKIYRRLAKQKQEEIYNQLLTKYTSPPYNWSTQKAHEQSILLADSEYKKIWDTTNNEPDNTYPDYSALLKQAKSKALASQPLKDQIAARAQELADAEVQTYKREHISQTELAELGTVQLAGLIQNPDAASIETDDLAEPTKSQVKNITGSDDFSTGSVAELKNFISTHPHLVRGIDLALLLAIFDAIPQALAANLTESEQEQFKQMVA